MTKALYDVPLYRSLLVAFVLPLFSLRVHSHELFIPFLGPHRLGLTRQLTARTQRGAPAVSKYNTVFEVFEEAITAHILTQSSG
jgi:hypothetical protein